MDTDASDPREPGATNDHATAGDPYDDTPRTGHHPPTGMVGDCPAIRGLQQDLARVATTPASVLVTGESGTGKELVARAVHVMSGRPGRFVAVNCGAIAPELLASHLFGHERGSFTGAAARHTGYFEQANRGTLLLDEITEMPAALQVYLLRALETGTITRVGGTTPVEFDTRIVAATNRDPARAIDEGMLREDLFYRLADFIVELPPLRARGDDAVLLAEHFLAALNEEHGTRRHFAPGAADAIRGYDWPGNVRELRSVVQRAFILGRGNAVEIRDPAHPVLRRRASDDDADSVVFTVGMSYAEVQQEMLRRTLAHYDNDKARAARTLGVSVRTIHNQLARERRGARRAAPDAADDGAAPSPSSRSSDDDVHALSA